MLRAALGSRSGPLRWLLLCALCAFLPARPGSGYSAAQGPVFLQEPPPLVQFLNSTGAVVDCSAAGQPEPRVAWLDATGHEVLHVPGLREVLDNGSLYFPPFPAQMFRPNLHANTYRCRAANAVGTVISRDCSIRGETLNAWLTQVHRVQSLAGNVAVLRCSVPAAARHLVRVVEWLRDNDVIHTSGRYTATSQGTLHIRDVQERDMADTYYCQTQHVISLDVRVSSGGQVIVKAPEGDVPLHIDSAPSTVHARAGSATELVCAAQGHPPPTYRWYRDVNGNLLELDPHHPRARPLDSVLEFPRAQPEDSGRYACVVSNRVKEVRRHLQLVVSHALSVHLRPQHQVVDAGRTVAFNCTVRGGVIPPSVVFLKDGLPVGQGGRLSVHSTQSGMDLVVRRVTPADRGMYQCVASSGEETAQAAAELALGAIAPELLDGFREQTLQPGPPLSLHCAVSGQPPPRVSWLLDGAEIPPLLQPAYQLGSFVTARGHVIAHLNVSAVRVDQGGLYTCLARNILGAVHHSAPINVYGPPKARPPLNLTVVADTDVHLRCPVAGYPVTSVTWSRGGVRLPNNMMQRVFPNGTLLLRAVQGSVDRGQYDCTVTNQQGQLAHSKLHLNVMKPPVIVPFSFHSGLEDGNRLQVSCSIMSGDLPIGIEWRKDGQPLPPDDSVSEQQHQFASNLLFSDLGARHSGSYTCVASNAAASTNFTAPLVVRVRPRWLVEPHDVEVLHQEAAAIHCRASGFPEPTVTWMRAPEQAGAGTGASSSPTLTADEGSSGEYSPLGGDFSLAENGSVLVAAAQPSHAGRYMCQAKNGIGPGISKVVHLRVKVPAYFHTRAVNVSGAAGQSVVLECSALGDTPLSVAWSTPGGGEPSPNRVLETPVVPSRMVRGGITSQLHLVAERHHAGVYRCTATNKYGSDSMVVYLAVQEAPTAPMGVEVLETGSRWLSLGWSLEGSGATHYVIQFRREVLTPEPPTWYNVSVSGGPSSRSAKLTGLDPATAYLVRVMAANEVGVGPPSEPVSTQTMQEAPTVPPADVFAEALSPESLTIRWKPPSQLANLLGHQVHYRAVSLPGQPSLSALPAVQQQGDLDDGVDVGGGSASWELRTVRGVGAGAALKHEVVLSGLESFTRYEVTVRGFNEVGVGPASQPVIATTMEGVPTEPPGSVRCTPLTSQNVRVRWEPPPKAGRRGVLDGYKVFYRRKLPAGLPAHDLPAWMLASPELEVKKTMNLETNLFGLAKYSNYTVQVAALTSVGEGVRSEPVHCTTEEDVPGPPEQVKALAMSSDSILVTWTRPLEANGNIAKYLVYMRPTQPQGQSREVRKETVYAGGDRGADLALEVRRLKELERLDLWVTAATSVGEGPPSARVNQAPVSRVPARIASFSRSAAAGEGQMLTLPCRAVGVPAPSRTWHGPHGLARTVAVNGGLNADHSEHAGSRAVLIGDGSLRLGPLSLQDAGNYSCEAVNVFGKDEIQYRVMVVGPPAAPALALAAATDRSLTLQWTHGDASGRAPISGYVLQFKRELGEWQERDLDGEISSFTLPGLRCGSPYLLSLAAVNGVGRGARSSTLQASTKGAPPKVPTSEEVLSVNSSTASLFLDAWPVAGCPVTYFVVDFRTREPEGRPGPWTLVANRAGPQQTVAVAGLAPASWYELRVAAHSDAGSTRHQFLFATRTKTGDLVPLELMPALTEGPGPLTLPSPVTLLVAVVSGLVCTAAVATCAIVAFRKRRGDAKTLDELENQRNLEHHVHQHHHHQGLPGLPGLPPLQDQQLYSPSPARKAISSSLAGQKGSDTSDYEICPYATFSLANASQASRPGAGGGAGTGTLTPSKSLASYSLQLHTFSQRDCYAEGPPRRPTYSSSRSRSKASLAAAGVVASATPRPSDSEISCISSQQTLPMSLAVHQRRKTASPTHCRDRGASRPRSLVMAAGPGARYESDSSSPSDKHNHHHGHNHHHYRQHAPHAQHAHTPSRRSSKSHDNDSSGDSADASPEIHHRMQGPSCRSLPRRSSSAVGSPRSRPRSRQQSRHRDSERHADVGRGSRLSSPCGSDAGVDVVLNGDLDLGDGLGQEDADGHYPSRSQLLLPDAQLEQELSSLIKRYRHDRQREKQDYTIHV